MPATVSTTFLTGTLPAVQPFDLRASVRFLRGFGACKGDQVLTDTGITKALSLDGRAVVFQLTPVPEGVRYELSSHSPPAADAELRVRTALDAYLSLSDDLRPFYALAQADHPAYASLVRRLHGLHHVRFLTLAEIAVWALVSQRTSRSDALGAKRAITALGPTLTLNGTRFQAFPETDLLADLTHADWLDLVGHERKALYLGHLLRGLAGMGETYLRTAPYAEAYAALRSVKGVGDWTASAILLRGLGRMNHVPLEMRQFAVPAAAVYGGPVDPAALRRHYGEHLGYWSYYLRVGAS
ncbi:DNA-3-methyladenine glycosylase family protein [Streptacidiphilus jiangxiensis]|uniref:DNA-3-methyladenine glycosylase II n=1 Tax=Streptacidiphilus jiangxiensis TaxID=235985 RepID=A0A1H7L8V3_STRJI|nr:hypothetical protein [Streptacidiphilus jiangxiensis]SEK94905.1 DNA-3-methyladenine glycosylase II [Streptacidiphilus jiangxiensis]